MQDEFRIEKVSWKTHARSLKNVREQVFIIEQEVPATLEWDGLDDDSQHLIALNVKGEALGCVRLLSGGIIGRMAVLKFWRGQGLGYALLQRAIAIHQQQGEQVVILSAQWHAINFYEKSGFVRCSPPYLDANILHIDMQLVTPIA